jgi:FlaA1/EpsC-like NDP-sugar epimerase
MKTGKHAILVTGGAGAIGSALVEYLLKTMGDTYTIRVFDSDEYGIWQLQQKLKGNPNVRYLLGSVRNYPRIEDAMHGVKYVFHTAAYKHVALCEYNPFDAVETNVIGTQNTIRAAIASGTVEKFLYISTDKAVNPTSLMGATKLIGERLVIAAKYASGLRPARFSAARFPNVIQTRGNVFEAWPKQLEQNGKILVTDPEMVRYFLPIDSAIKFLIDAFSLMEGGEVFIPNLTEADTRKIVDVAQEWLSKQDKKGEIVFGTPEYGEKLFENLHSDVEEPYIEVLSDITRVIRSPAYDFIHWKQADGK